MDLDALAPDVDRLQADVTELSAFTDSTLPGWTRSIFTEPYRESRGWVQAKMAAAGLDVHVDLGGNIVGYLPGRTGGADLVMGSHTDTVHSGGRFDGVVGVLGAIEVARRLQETGTVLEHGLRVVDFLGEEPNTYGVSCVGSRTIAGTLSKEYLAHADDDGLALGDRLEQAGMDVSAMMGAAWSPARIHAFVEMHIEQGPVLEREGMQIGVVTAIAGIERALAHFIGRADHTGTMPMRDRLDALTAAAEAILIVEQIGCSVPDAVATVGRIEALPGSANIVPDSVRVWAEMRSASAQWLGEASASLLERITELAQRRGLDVEIEWLNDQDPVPASPLVQDVIAEAATSLGHRWMSLPSGAGHDAAHLAALAPTGMIFVPSRAGRSHCPEEWTDIADVATGVHTLGATLMALDRLDRGR